MTNFLFGNRFTAHKFFEFFYILITVKSKTMPLTTITTTTPCFLIIALNTLWNIIMDYKTNVWFVNSHPKGNGSNDNIHIFHQKHILMLYAGFAVKSCVIGNSFYTVNLLRLRKFFHPFSA